MAGRRPWLLPDHSGWNPFFYEWYFGTPLGAAIRAREERAVFGFLGRVMEPHHSVLEVGCGTGNYTVPLARRCAGVVAVDPAPEMLRYLEERLGREELANVEVRRGRLPEELGTDERFDGVLAVGVLNYVENIGGALRSLAAALRPEGWAVFTVPLPTAEGRVYALSELVNRRRVYLRSRKEAARLAGDVGLHIESMEQAGLGRSGLTLVVGAAAG